MNAIGPVEPGRDTYEPAAAPAHRTAPGFATRHRPALIASGAAAALAAALLLVHLADGSPASAPAPATARPAPWPAGTVWMHYEGGMARPAAGARSFSFHAVIGNGTPGDGPVPRVRVRRVGQPSAALSVTIRPDAPFTLKSGTRRKTVITMHIRECSKVPRNAGLPFLEVTLRNTRGIQQQSFILGSAYAEDLSRALNAACPRTPAS